MIVLEPTDVLQLVTNGPAVLKIHVSWVDNGGLPDLGRKNTSVNSASTTTIVPTPPAGTFRNVKFISIQNIDPSVSNTISVLQNDEATPQPIQPLGGGVLLAGYTLTYNDLNGWKLFNTAGAGSGPA